MTLHPVSKGNVALGITDFGGRLVLETFERGDGVVPGEYKISVRKTEAVADAAQPEPAEPVTSTGPKAPESRNVLPVKYLDFNESGLSVTVGKEPISLLDLKLEG